MNIGTIVKKILKLSLIKAKYKKINMYKIKNQNTIFIKI